MAQRRMFSLEVCDTDAFLDLPVSSQALYFHLGMRADDDGFVSNPKKITAMVNCSADDLKLLFAKGFVIPFNSGVCVIRDWRVNNYIQKDRYHETRYLTEKAMMAIESNQSYSVYPSCIQAVSSLDTQDRLGKGSSAKVNRELGVSQAKTPKKHNSSKKKIVPPTLDEVKDYCKQRKNSVDAQKFFDYFEASGWVDSKGNPVRNWKQKIITWEGSEQNGKYGTGGVSDGHSSQEISIPGITVL